MNNDFKTYSELYHYGILGMKWGVRRFQNKDGSLTEEGKRRQKLSDSEAYKEYLSDKQKISDKYGGSEALTLVGATGAGILGGVVASTVGGPAAYVAVRVGALIASLPALRMMEKNADKTIDEVKNSYGKKRTNGGVV